MQSSILSNKQNIEFLFIYNIKPKYEFKRIKKEFFTHPINNKLHVRFKFLWIFVSKYLGLSLIILSYDSLVTEEDISLAIKFIIDQFLAAQHSSYPLIVHFCGLVFIIMIHQFIDKELYFAFHQFLIVIIILFKIFFFVLLYSMHV